MTDVKLKEVQFGISITKTPVDDTSFGIKSTSDKFKIEVFIGTNGHMPIILKMHEDQFLPSDTTNAGAFVDQVELSARRIFEYLGFPSDEFQVRRYLNVVKTQYVQEEVSEF